DVLAAIARTVPGILPRLAAGLCVWRHPRGWQLPTDRGQSAERCRTPHRKFIDQRKGAPYQTLGGIARDSQGVRPTIKSAPDNRTVPREPETTRCQGKS